MVLATLEGINIEVLDPRPFLDPWMAGPGTLTARAPTPAEWSEIQAGFALARHLARARHPAPATPPAGGHRAARDDSDHRKAHRDRQVDEG